MRICKDGSAVSLNFWLFKLAVGKGGKTRFRVSYDLF